VNPGFERLEALRKRFAAATYTAELADAIRIWEARLEKAEREKRETVAAMCRRRLGELRESMAAAKADKRRKEATI